MAVTAQLRGGCRDGFFSRVFFLISVLLFIYLFNFSSLPPPPLAQTRFWPRSPPVGLTGSPRPLPPVGCHRIGSSPPQSQPVPLLGELRGVGGDQEKGEGNSQTLTQGGGESHTPFLAPGSSAMGLCCPQGSFPSAPAPLAPAAPTPCSLINIYTVLYKIPVLLSPAGGAGSLPAPSVTWGTPCRATAPAGSPARSPVSGCSAVR